MKTESEVKEELDRFFPGESNDARFVEWLALVNAAVQEVIAAREYYGASIAMVVSNAAFTTAARQLAAMAGVGLLHHSEIAGHSLKLGVGLRGEPVAEV